MTTLVVLREQWGARPPRSTQRITGVKGLAVHYSGADSDEQADHANCPGRVRSIQNFHMDGRGWADIAYSWLACKHGVLFEGRGPNRRTAANGTNAGNDAYLAVCFLGDDTAGRDDVTDPGREALALAVTLTRQAWPGANDIKPHSHFKATACPGDQLRAWITGGTTEEDDLPYSKNELIDAAAAGAARALEQYGNIGGKSLLARLDGDTDAIAPIQQSVEKILAIVQSGGGGELSPAAMAAALRAAADKLDGQ